MMINKLLNKIQNGCSEYIDCNTPKTKRNKIIKKYKEGSIPFLVNVRILVEGFDAPITKGICFMHLPSNNTILIQIIGRALRIHPLKTIAHIILPFSSNEVENNINNFLKVMAINDRRIRQSYENKKIGGYISIENNIIDNNEDIEFKYNLVFDKMGILINNEEIWYKKLEEVKKYIDENNKRPSKHDNNNCIKSLGIWISNQNINYKNKNYNMKNQEIYNKWTDFINNYKEYFISNDERWYNTLEKLKIYIDENNKRPSNDIKSLDTWLIDQNRNYKNKEHIMKNQEIYNKWTEFINNYKEYFISNDEIWYNRLEEVKKYIDENNRKPLSTDKNDYIKSLGLWISTQKQNYKNKEQIMKNQEIYNNWTEFINNSKYKDFLLSNEEEWYNRFNEVKKYIDINDKLPSQTDKNDYIKSLGLWIYTQKQNYKKQIMNNIEIYNIWTEFINNYKEYFMSNEEQWYSKLNEVKNYIDKNNKKPSDKKLGKWFQRQNQNYKNKKQIMKNQEIYNKWNEFINNPKYKN
jgi:hypothetical protein